ncbi:MAG: hypothetical protein JST75_12905 [Bacteroidetes bacterium]|nr:hypothetical protein [Bacteroidota bacterium]
MRFILVPLLLIVFFVLDAAGQDTLPGFSVILKDNGKVIVSWRNGYPVINQISIQRSSDSLKNFTTLLSVPDPTIAENGFVDSKAKGTTMFYRLFILLGNSKYIFTKAKRAVTETVAAAVVQKTPTEEEEITLNKVDNQRIFYQQDNSNKKNPTVTTPLKLSTPAPIKVEKTVYIKIKDSVIGKVSGKMISAFRDSVLSKTKDTILFVHADTILIKNYIAPIKEVKEVYKISTYVFTGKDGNVNISLADATRKKYSVKFFEQDNTLVLEVKDIKDLLLIVDKVNFIHAGWFRFELYEDGKLKEKNKLFIPKDF